MKRETLDALRALAAQLEGAPLMYRDDEPVFDPLDLTDEEGERVLVEHGRLGCRGMWLVDGDSDPCADEADVFHAVWGGWLCSDHARRHTCCSSCFIGQPCGREEGCICGVPIV